MLMKMFITVKISKAFARWKEMAESLNPEMEKVGVKLIWAATNPEESKIFMIVHMVDASQIKTFRERPDIFKARTEVGADVASTTVISKIGEDWLPNLGTKKFCLLRQVIIAKLYLKQDYYRINKINIIKGPKL